MKTVKENILSELIIKNSRFIALIIKIDSTDISEILDSIKVKYPKATHYCYAYQFNDISKSSDDGEPTGTAGVPILGVIQKEGLNNILVVVVRYFGGIKLGAGGLIRAYTKAVVEALKCATFINLVEGFKIEITFSYDLEKQIDYLLKDSYITDRKYDEKITYTALINKDLVSKLSNYDFKIIDDTYIEKKE